MKKYGDSRGYFMETYKKEDFDKAGLVYNFIQDNQSKSKKGVLSPATIRTYTIKLDQLSDSFKNENILLQSQRNL